MPGNDWFVRNANGKERDGILMKLEEDASSRYKYEIWFEYTRKAMNEIREGTMVAVPNYATTQAEKCFSILEITGIKPIHYAIGENPSGYPGFVMEAAKNAAQDWTGQDDEPSEDTTTIQCTAIPTNLEMYWDTQGKDYKFRAEQNLPMVGSIAKILETHLTRKVVNRSINIEAEQASIFVGGDLLQNHDVQVYVRTEDFIKVHFGIFGFTGAGKSNLLSTYIANLLNREQKTKIVFFDLMSEYTILLLDLLQSSNINGNILTLGDKTLPQGVFEYINEAPSNRSTANLDIATEQLQRYTLLPKALLPYQAEISVALKGLIESERIRYFDKDQNLTVHDLFLTSNYWSMNRQAQKTNTRTRLAYEILKPYKIDDYKKCNFTPELAKRLKQSIKDTLNRDRQNQEFEADFKGIIIKLDELEKITSKQYAAATSLESLINDLNDENHSSLWIIQAHNSDELRMFAKNLGDSIYERRRQNGLIEPLVSFIFDEADEFIPQQASGSYIDSRDIVHTLARRGRKFGLGIGIATQRTRYLDTSIMAQPHTYLISKLPRKSDREVVAEAFGISEEMFQQTFKFQAGNWLLISHEATGLKAVPVPIQTYDANKRISAFLEAEYNKDHTIR